MVSVPSNADTVGMVNAESYAAMRASSVILNVGRGPTIDERSLYEARDPAHRRRRYRHLVQLSLPDHPSILPSKFPFHELPNVVMTPHMSGWTTGTINRRKQAIADNIIRRAAGRP